MQTPVSVNVVEDDSVSKKIDATAKKLQNKYQKKRNINEKWLKQKSPFQKTISVIFDVLCFVLVIASALVCFSAFNARIQKTVPSILGYSNLTIISGSMVASGHNIGDVVVVRAVDTDSLKVGDKIAFYACSTINSTFDINSCEKVTVDESTKTQWKVLSFGSLLGIQSSEIKAAAQSKSSLVFHHIKEIYTDKSGHRWFVTQGSSNDYTDVNMFGYIKDSMVVGSYVNTGWANFLSVIVRGMSSIWGVMVILIPVVLMAAIMVLESIKEVQKAKLELDCVEEKRKITDPICVKNNIGYGMDKKTKYKVLAQANENEKAEYATLLWKDGSAPESIRKYIHRKRLLLRGNRKLLALNRECAKMFADGEKPSKIAKYYLGEKSKIEAEQERYQQRIKNLRKLNAENKN